MKMVVIDVQGKDVERWVEHDGLEEAL